MRLVGRYELREMIGEGAMAEVWRAYDPSIDRVLAIKLLRPEIRANTECAARFLREARAAGALAHPAIVTVYDVGEADGFPYIAMELLDDLAKQYPDRLKAMQALFDQQARANNVYPLDDRFGMARPSSFIAHADPRREFTYWGKDVTVGSGVAPSFAARSFTVRAEIDLPDGHATGVLLANGSWFGGWSFYLKDGRPIAREAFSQRPEHQYVIAGTEPLGAGHHVVEYSFAIDAPKPFAGGTLSVSVDGKPVASGRVEHTIVHTAGNGETLDIGRDTGAPVTDDYPGQGVFPGEIARVTVGLGVAPTLPRHIPAD
jgi:hypothetical protein